MANAMSNRLTVMVSGYLNFVGNSARRKLTAAIMALVSGAVHAAPQGGNVVAGSADLEAGDNVFNVNQHSDRVVIEFDEFSVDADETVNFFQPDANSVALNRVVGNNLSDIHGQINANGQVFLINPNGVVFGQGALVDVGALVISTLDIQNQDFLDGHLQFSGEVPGSISVSGEIHADERAVFIAPKVSNAGQVTAQEVVFYSGNDVYLPVEGSQIPVLVEDDSVGSIHNAGNVTAQRVVMAMAGAKESLLRNDGLIRASSLSGDGGNVELLAPAANVVNTGTLDVNAVEGNGGSIVVESHRLAQVGNMSADAVGLGQAGQMNLHAGDTIVLHQGAELSANADTQGDGGEIIVLAENATWHQEGSSIAARGGDAGGDGGFVEVSGRNFVSIEAVVDVRAPSGEDGLWYIDPTDITISAGGDTNGNYALSGSDYIWQLAGSPSSSVINGANLQNQLINFGNVEIDTNSGGGASGNINFNYALDYNGIPDGRTLTLRADSNISFQASAAITDSDLGTTNGLSLVLDAGGDLLYQSNSFTAIGTGTYTAAVGGNVTMFSSTLLSGSGDTTLNVGGIFSMNTGAVVSIANQFAVNAGSNIQVAEVTSLSSSDEAIRLFTTGGSIIDDGNNTTALRATSGGVFLSSYDGIANLDLDTDTLGLRNVNSGNVAITRTGDLTLTSLLIGDNMTMSVTTDGDITYSGSLNADLDGIANGQISLTSTAGSIALNNTLTDFTGGVDHDVDLVFNANTDFSVADGFIIHSGAGTLSVTAANGDASITGLATLSTLQNGISVSAVNGQILDAGNTYTDLNVPDGGFVLSANGNITDIETNSNFFDVVSTTGDISLNENANFEAVRLQAAGSINITAVGISIPDAVPFSATNLSIDVTNNLLLMDAPLVLTGALNLSGANITDQSDTRSLDFSADSLTLSSSLSGGDLSLATDVNTLSLINSGTNVLNVTETDAVTVNQVGGSGNIDLSLSAGDATFGVSTLTHTGQLSLTTAGAGNWIVPDAGLTTSGDLVIDVAAINDSDSTVILGAADANLTIRNSASNTEIQSSFDTATIDYQAATDFTLTDSDAVQIDSLNAGRDAVISSTDGDLTVISAPTVVGTLTLQALNSGDLIIPAAGISHGGNFTILADALSDGDNTLSLGANNADITLRNSLVSTQINSAFAQLDIDYQGGSDLSVIDANGLIVNSVNASGDLNLSTTDADLTLLNAPTGVSALSLSAVNSGDVIIPAAGLSHAGDLSLLADNISDGDQDLTLAANDLQIQLRDGAAASTFNTTVSTLDFTSAGAGLITFIDSDGLQVDAFATAGAADIQSTSADLVFTADPSVAGEFTLQTNTSGDLVLPAAGLSHAANLTVLADAINDGDSTVTLSANNADLTLRASATDSVFNTSFAQLDLDYQGGSNVTVTDSDALVLNSLNADADASINSTTADLTLSAAPTVTGALNLAAQTSGDVIIPAAGLSHAGDLSLLADNISDGDQDLTLAANDLQIQLRDGAAASTFNATVSTLDFTSAGAGLITFIDSDGLQVDAFTAAGAADIQSTSADLVFTANPSVTGDLTLQTNTSGDLVLPAAGLSHAANLTVLADAINDGDSTVTLSANNADLTLRASATDSVFNTSFAQLDLDYQGGSNVTVTDSDALVLNSLNADADASINSTASDLTLSAGPTLTGALNLAAQTSGDVIIPAAGLSQGGGLSMLADNISDGDQDLTLAANDLQIQLRDGAAASTFNTTVATLDFTNAGAGLVTFIDSDGLQVDAFTAAGAADIQSTSADLVFTADPSVTGDLTLQTNTSGDLVLPAAGLSHAANLTVLADAINDGDSTVTLGANNADLTLRASATDTVFNASFAQLDLDYQGGSNVTVTDSDALTLNTLNADADALISATNADLTLLNNATVIGDLSLQAAGSGDLVVPAAGVSTVGNLIVLADAIFDGDFDVTLGANNADITLRDSASDTTINSTFDQLVIDYSGSSNLVVTDSDGLTVTDVSASGDLTLNSTDADLVIADTTPVGAGSVSLNALNSGDVVIPAIGFIHSGTLSILADNISDGDQDVLLGGSAGQISLRDGALESVFNTTFDTLDFTSAGTGMVTVVDADGLQVDGFVTAGEALIQSTSADLVFTADPNVAGVLTLEAVTSGDLILDAAGLSHSDDLIITADSVSDGDSSVTLSAANADITLRDSASDTTLNTAFDVLDLNYQGASDVSVVDVDALTLASLNATGSAAVSATSADLTVTALIGSAGSLNLSTVTSGDVVIADAGFTQSGDLSITADNLRDADQDIILGANAFQVQLRDGTAATVLNTSIDNLDFTSAGTGSVSVLDSDGLQVDAFITAGDALLSASSADLVIAAQPTVPGDLTLQTLVSGNVQIPATGLVQASNLTVVADALVDGDSSLSLAATGANLTLRNSPTDTTINSSFDLLDVNYTGGSNLFITDSDALIINSAVADSDATFASTNGDLMLLANPNITGDLSLQTVGSGALIIPAAGLIHAADLVIVADEISDGDASVSLAANTAAITLRNSATESVLNTNFAQLNLDYQANNLVTVVDVDDLVVTGLSTGGAATFTVNGHLDLSALAATPAVLGDWLINTSSTGDLILNALGLTHGGTLNINANTLRDDDSSVQITAQNAVLALSQASSLTINSQFDTLDITAGGPANITVNETDALDLLAASVDGVFNLLTASDLNIDTAIDLDGMDALNLQSQGDLNINANLQDSSGAVDNSTALALSAANSFTIADGLSVDAGSGSIAVTAVAGDATITGLRTTSAANDAVVITAGGSILDGGDSARDIRAGDGLNNGSVTLDAQSGIAGLETSAADFVIRNADASDVVISDASNIRINELTTLGYAELNAGGALRFYPGATVSVDDLLAQGTNIRLSNAGLDVPGTLDIRASQSLENAESGGAINLAATILMLDIDASNADLDLQTEVSELSLDYEGADALSLTNNADLMLNSLRLAGGDVLLQSADGFNFDVLGPVDLSAAGSAALTLISGADLNIQTDIDHRAAGVDNSGLLDFQALADVSFAQDVLVHSGLGQLSVSAGGAVNAAGLESNNTASDAISVSANRIAQVSNTLPSMVATNGGISLNAGLIGVDGSPLLTDAASLSLQGQAPNASAFVANQGSVNIEALSGLTSAALSILNAGDILFVNDSVDVSGALQVDLSDGQVILADTGLQTPGSLFINANGIADSDNIVSLSASNATLNLGALTAATRLNTAFDSLSLNASGADISVNDVDALTLSSLASSHNASIQTNNADLSMTSATTNVSGDLSLATVGAGNVVLVDAGIAHSGLLNITADQVVDSDANIQLSANSAQIELRAHNSSATWQTTFGQLDLQKQGSGSLTLINSTDLTLNDLNAVGLVELRSAGDLTLAAVSSADDLSLLTLGDGQVLLPNAGASINGLWLIDTAEISALDGTSPAQLEGASANINIRNGAIATRLLTDLGELSINFAGTSDLSIQSLSDLQVNSLNSGGAVRLESLASLGLAFASSAISDLRVAAPSGQVQLSNQGLSNNGDLSITAQDLVQSESASLGLSAASLDIALTAPAGDHTWQVAADVLSVALGGSANLNINSSRTLELRDISTQTGTVGEAITINNGNLNLVQSAGELTISDRIVARDTSADAAVGGVIDISNRSGGIQVNAGVISDRSQDLAGADSLGVHFALVNNDSGQFDIELNEDLTAIGGDILLNAGTGRVVQNTGVEISAYNNLGDATDGIVEINGRVVEPETGQFIRSDRKLSIIDGRALPPLEPELDPSDVTDSLDDASDVGQPVESEAEAGKSAGSVFELAYGQCNDLEENSSNRCRIDAALKAFLSHWLVGGEMPPKSEIRQ